MRRPRAIGHQVLGEGAHQRLGPLHQRVGQLAEVVDRAAVVVVAAGVERHAVLAHPQPAGDVEAVERQADRIHEPVAGVAGRVGAVHLHPLARGEQLAVLGLAGLLERRDVGRRRRRRRAEQHLHHPLAAQHRRGAVGERGLHQHRRPGRAGRGACGRDRAPCGTAGRPRPGSRSDGPAARSRTCSRRCRDRAGCASRRTRSLKKVSVSSFIAAAMLSSKFGKKFGSGWTLSRSWSRSHWAAKRVPSAAARGSASMRRACFSSTPGAVSLPLLASAEQLLVGRSAPEEEREARGEVEVGDAGRALGRRRPAARAPSGTRSAGWPAPPRAPRAPRPRSRRRAAPFS